MHLVRQLMDIIKLQRSWRLVRSDRSLKLRRPALMGFDTDPADYSPTEVQETHDWPLTYTLTFDRTAGTGFHHALNYQIVVSWMIAEHKSQGLLQIMYGKDSKVYIWVDPQSAPSADVTAASLFRLITPALLQSTASN